MIVDKLRKYFYILLNIIDLNLPLSEILSINTNIIYNINTGKDKIDNFNLFVRLFENIGLYIPTYLGIKFVVYLVSLFIKSASIISVFYFIIPFLIYGELFALGGVNYNDIFHVALSILRIILKLLVFLCFDILFIWIFSTSNYFLFQPRLVAELFDFH